MLQGWAGDVGKEILNKEKKKKKKKNKTSRPSLSIVAPPGLPKPT